MFIETQESGQVQVFFLLLFEMKAFTMPRNKDQNKFSKSKGKICLSRFVSFVVNLDCGIRSQIR